MWPYDGLPILTDGADAVAYDREHKGEARKRCRGLTDEEMLARGKRYPWRRFSLAGPIGGLAGCEYVLVPNFLGSDALNCWASDGAHDYDWQQIEPGLYVGTIKPEAYDRVRKAARDAATVEARRPVEPLSGGDARDFDEYADGLRAAIPVAALRPAEPATQDTGASDASAEAVADKQIQHGLKTYYMAVADIAGVRRAERLSLARLMAIAAISEVDVKPLPDFMAAIAGEDSD